MERQPTEPGQPRDADQLVRDLLAQGSESLVDYKAAMSVPTDAPGRASLAKDVIGWSNCKDGGYLLIGVDDKTHDPAGLSEAQVATWDAADLTSSLSAFAAPPPVVQVFRGSLPDGTILVAVRVVPFQDQPLVCIKSVDHRGHSVTRSGALYIRAPGTQTKEITTEAEMRELLGRAYVTRADRLLSEIKALIDAHWPGGVTSPADDLLALIDRDLSSMELP